ncbi:MULTISPECIES: glycerol-3-phosphate responsive antiterminator [Dictyoglomus]|jgi:glycerol uptake operon antiterminator|uniref:Glycerol-3-phosphate responsive antiterminator, GlpP n=1 Tax=Dictyoglomus turgidum (strain DSM 6724 / Z-1310) TaxID=515635 RepID=B8DYS8_DICTD|nr:MULTISPECIES: glycerol-3-phosphate responsive antiterminator [Dictyoglomus]ACK41460.1 glycerol-3-phosphate responsive antiterminator, GlpP [Dictyoglomus turgidum DSM 6724]HBU31849.1 glycerol-3-phosphate responsive antiterminator [Dictyoglomus sp.]
MEKKRLSKEEFLDVLKGNPIIAAVREEERLSQALQSKAKVLFLLKTNVLTLPNVVQEIKSHGKLVFIHLDLLEGLAQDKYALRYLGDVVGIDGVITTRANLIQQAKAEDLIAIQRFFVLDSSALATGVKIMQSAEPDMVEILPGIIFIHLGEELRTQIPYPLIAGGLIRTPEEAREILKAGATAVSTTSVTLWNM